jgi:ABC-type transporter Mla maintaining outer membrane lipid asymmetry ATPase subunit MlaF
VTKIVLPAQTINIDTPTGGVDPIWYEKMQQLTAFANLFSEINFATMPNNQTLRWNATMKKFFPGA